MDPRYAALVEWILYSYDSSKRISDRPGSTEWAKGETRGLEGVLGWLTGFEHTDLEGLRRMVAEHS